MIIKRIATIAILSLCLFVAAKVFFIDWFIINGHSMEPTLKTRDVVYVNKLIMGARISSPLDFSSSKPQCFRMPGLRKPKVGDIVVYNYPEGRGEGKIEFEINYVCCKRCVGCPGDSISICSGYYHNTSVKRIGVPTSGQEELSCLSSEMMRSLHIARIAYSFAQTNWTIQHFGPLYIPAKGDIILLDSLNASLYQKEILYETGLPPTIGEHYVFSNNWYFFCGDNVLNSRDSRYLGLIPESFIIGIVEQRWTKAAIRGSLLKNRSLH